jgi:FKBP-type peptidyl-prolyl cis-trans isomerase
VRTALSIVVALGLAASLAACSSGGTATSTSTPKAASTSASSASSTDAACAATASGKISDAVAVTGKAGAEPTVKFATPLTVSTTQRTVVTQGTGAQIVKGESFNVAFVLYDGTTGKAVTTVGYGSSAAATFTDDESAFLVGLIRATNCSTIGSRVVGVIPPSEAWGTTGQETLGVAGTDSLVFVADILSKQASKATGKAVAPKAGFPTVKLAADGTPTVTIPDTTPPKTLKIEVLKKGTGTKVASGDNVTVQYQGINWTTKKVFDQSWGSAPASFATTAVVTGFGKAMVGQTVGSQVEVIIPPADGYGTAGQESAGISGTDTLVFVIDILATS